ncbi:MAG: hypothetical protein JSW42_09945 [Chloroflexota bacterium]|nr:MAG: hypothetical protein JSW42_09945 [Chloroflexota bacterium]
MDLKIPFHLGNTILTCASTQGTLTGETIDGIPIEGSDHIRMIDDEVFGN